MRHLLRPLVASFTFALAACGGATDSSPIRTTSAGETEVSPAADSVSSRGHSLVRVVNATSTGRPITVQLGERTLFREIAAGVVTDYSEVETNIAQFSVLSGGAPSGTMLAQTDRILLDGNRYTVFVISQDVSQQALRVVRDDVIPDSGMARLRFLHAAPGGPELDVVMPRSAEPIFSSVDFLADAGPIDLSPTGTLALEVRADGRTPVLLTLAPVELRRGTTTTIVITGTSSLASFRFTDAMMPRTPKP